MAGFATFSVALRVGVADYRAIYTRWTWLAGWLARVFCQVAFFALIGRLVDSPATTRFLVVGNAVAMVVVEAFFVCASTAWERQSGALPLLIAAPGSVWTVFTGRSLFWLGSGVATSSLSLLIVGPIFGVWVSGTGLLALAAIPVIGLAAYAFALTLAGLVLRFMEIRNLVSNVAVLMLTIFCGVQVPATYWPRGVQLVSDFLPLRHGLAAVRLLMSPQLEAGAAMREIGLEIAVGALWFAMSFVCFRWLVEGGRRNGSIEFGT